MFLAHVVVSMLQIWLTQYLPNTAMLYITSFGIRRSVSFMLTMVLVISCGLHILWYGFHSSRPSSMGMQNTDAYQLGPSSTINTASLRDKDPANSVEIVKCCCGKKCKRVKGLKLQ